MNKCKGIFGLLFGHKFEGRYNVEKSEGKWPLQEGSIESQITSTNPDSVYAIIESSRDQKKTYVKDVCVRCGEVIERK
jgi:hypothetical protein